jgi:hypothetical protein
MTEEAKDTNKSISTLTEEAKGQVYTNKYIPATSTTTSNVTSSSLDSLLEREKQNNKADSWNKLDKTVKTQALHSFAETYGKENALSAKDIKSLKMFFSDCLKTNKMNKTKDVKYDKEARTILSIPALSYNAATHNFTLKNTDTKRVSTLKSLTPKRVAIEDKIE